MTRRREPGRMTADQVAEALSITRAELDALRDQGDAPLSVVGPGGDLLTRPADLGRWIDAHEVRPDSHGHLITAADLAQLEAAHRAYEAEQDGRP